MKKIKLLFATPLLSLAVLPTVASCSKAKINWAASSKDIEMTTVSQTKFITSDASKFYIKFDSSIQFNESEKDQYEVKQTYVRTGGTTDVVSIKFTPEYVVENSKVVGMKSLLEVQTPSLLSMEFNSIIKLMVEIKQNNQTKAIEQIDGIKLIFNPAK